MIHSKKIGVTDAVAISRELLRAFPARRSIEPVCSNGMKCEYMSSSVDRRASRETEQEFTRPALGQDGMHFVSRPLLRACVLISSVLAHTSARAGPLGAGEALANFSRRFLGEALGGRPGRVPSLACGSLRTVRSACSMSSLTTPRACGSSRSRQSRRIASGAGSNPAL